MSAAHLLERLENVRQVGDGRWVARCPSHDDRSPSLSVRETEDGQVLLFCFAGCDARAVVEAIGMTMRDLFPSLSAAEHAARFAAARRAQLWRLLWRERCILALAESDRRRGKHPTPEESRRIRQALRRVERIEGRLHAKS